MLAPGLIEIRIDQRIIVTNDKLIENLSKRTSCLGAESIIVQKMVASVAFGDVMSDRAGCAFDLIAEIEFAEI